MAVDYQVRERIAYISFARPEKHNALRDEDLASLVSALGQLDLDEKGDRHPLRAGPSNVPVRVRPIDGTSRQPA
jgi:hypothetical protein